MILLTDGYADQFGAETGKKFKSANLKRLILENAMLPINEIENCLLNKFENWKGSEEQVDDVCIIVLKVS